MYKTKITEIGSMVNEFIQEKMLIVFNDNAPDALREMSVLHTIEVLNHAVKVDDIVVFGDKEYLVTAVGHEANNTLETMGHCTFCFNGAETVQIPGQIELLGEEIPIVEVGFDFHIYST